MAELDTAKKNTDINAHLDRHKYYWIGLKRMGPGPRIGGGQGNFVWTHSGRTVTYSLWWNQFSEPGGNGDCVFKDSYRQDNTRQFGWADYPCSDSSWNRRNIHALCEIQDASKTIVKKVNEVKVVKTVSACLQHRTSTCYLTSNTKMTHTNAYNVSSPSRNVIWYPLLRSFI